MSGFDLYWTQDEIESVAGWTVYIDGEFHRDIHKSETQEVAGEWFEYIETSGESSESISVHMMAYSYEAVPSLPSGAKVFEVPEPGLALSLIVGALFVRFLRRIRSAPRHRSFSPSA